MNAKKRKIMDDEPKKQPPAKTQIQEFKDLREKLTEFKNEILNSTELELKALSKSMITFLGKIEKNIIEQNKILNKILDTNKITEETLCNVLLAVRQNEYLQAWYPAQHGFPEQKVVGVHPIHKKV